MQSDRSGLTFAKSLQKSVFPNNYADYKTDTILIILCKDIFLMRSNFCLILLDDGMKILRIDLKNVDLLYIDLKGLLFQATCRNFAS